MVFPSITVCNLNKIEASFLKEVGINGDPDAVDTLMKEFIDGRNESLTKVEEDTIEKVKNFIGLNYTFQEFSRQKCRDLFILITYQVSTYIQIS